MAMGREEGGAEEAKVLKKKNHRVHCKCPLLFFLKKKQVFPFYLFILNKGVVIVVNITSAVLTYVTQRAWALGIAQIGTAVPQIVLVFLLDYSYLHLHRLNF